MAKGIDLVFAQAKYREAVGVLGRTDADHRERLIAAYEQQASQALAGAAQPSGDLPAELVARIRAFDERLTQRPAVGSEGRIAATVRLMVDVEVQEAILELLAIDDELCRLMRDG